MELWLRTISVICIALGTIGCAGSWQPIVQPAPGYDAIRFRQVVQVDDHAVSTYLFSAGTVLVADRMTEDYGPVFCGNAWLNGMVFPTCVGFEGDTTLVIGPGAGFKEVRRQVPPGSVERFKAKM